MRRLTWLSAVALIAAAVLGIGGRAHAEVYSSRPPDRWGLAPDEVRITLSPGTGERFLGVIDLVMGTRVVKSLGHERYVVRIGDQGETDDYAAFFASLPYVLRVRPRPHRRPEERMPHGVIVGGANWSSGASPGGSPSGGAYAPGEMLVKFRSDVTAAQIAEFDAEHSVSVLGTLKLGSETIYKLSVPEGVDVRDLVAVYSASRLVEYAEPNYKMGIPERPGTIPTSSGGSSGFGTGVVMSGRELEGDSIVVTYRPDVVTPVPQLVAMVYGVRDIEDEDDGSVRYSLPAGVNPLTAIRLFKLCPYVQAAQLAQ